MQFRRFLSFKLPRRFPRSRLFIRVTFFMLHTILSSHRSNLPPSKHSSPFIAIPLLPGLLGLRPGGLGLRTGRMAQRGNERTNVRTYIQKISPFYRTSYPIGAAALPAPMKTKEKVEQGKGTADHLMPLGYLFPQFLGKKCINVN